MAASWAADAGEGRVKDVLPDAHADFVFAVMGEEFGLLDLPPGPQHLRLHRRARPAAAAGGDTTSSSSWPRPAW